MTENDQINFDHAALFEVWEKAHAEAVQARIDAAYEQGRLDEAARNREFTADLISGLLAQYADVAVSFDQFARVSREERIKAEKAEMIANARALAAELERPRGYVWRGIRRGSESNKIRITPSGWLQQDSAA